MIVKNSLLNYKDVVIYQDDEWFRFSLDSVILADFVNIRLSDKKIIDLCTGNAPIPMLLSYRTKGKIYGVEIQKEVYELGLKSVSENNMNEQIELINDDIKNFALITESDSFDVVVCNPPYFKTHDDSRINDNKVKSIARHEIFLNLDDIFKVSRKILKNGGTFAMVHRPSRLVEIIIKMKEYGIEPKRVQFVYPKEGSESNILLIEGTKNGKEGLKILSPLVVHNEDGSYREEIRKMYGE